MGQVSNAYNATSLFGVTITSGACCVTSSIVVHDVRELVFAKHGGEMWRSTVVLMIEISAQSSYLHHAENEAMNRYDDVVGS